MNTLNRTQALTTLALATLSAEASQPNKAGNSASAVGSIVPSASYVTTKDGVQLYYKTGGHETAKWSHSATAGR